MGQALYRKYRSRGFNEVIGQDHVVKTLQNALKLGRISHAYLFTGPRGVGKTSVARILAHEVNGLPYDEQTIHLDIIEIDAASNRRIDEIRELRERVHVAPTSAKYKVYIIDEVHMLTREAFNALLKTLEEPPEHCIFILATTEPHKLPETIISRTQRFSFKPVESQTAADHLSNIAKSEKIDIEPAALQLLAEHGSGSFRDSISLLDQLSGLGEKITLGRARQFLGVPAASTVSGILASIAEGQVAEVAQKLDELWEQGVDFVMAARALNQALRQQLLAGEAPDWAIKLLRDLSAIGAAPDPQSALEIDVLEAASTNQASKSSLNPAKPPTAVEPPQEAEPEPAPDPEPLPPPPEEPEVERPATPSVELKLDNWPQIVAAVKDDAPSLYTALRLAEPKLEADRLVLAFQFPLHRKKVDQAKNIDTLGKIIEELTGTKIKIDCVIDKNLKRPPKQSPAAVLIDDPSLQTINNIFGAAEVLES